jgi:hypothetical protein
MLFHRRGQLLIVRLEVLLKPVANTKLADVGVPVVVA